MSVNIYHASNDTLQTVAGAADIMATPAYTTMPVITSAMIGQIVQYVGTTDANYTQGWFYIASSDGAAEPTYSWQALMDSVPTSGSNNPVTSNGVYDALIIKRGTGIGSGTGGVGSSASGYNGFSFGHYASASGETSAAFGFRTIANRQYMMALGRYNLGKVGSIFEIGNGNFATGQRSNILEVSTAKMNVNGDIMRDGVGIDDYTTTERKIGKWIDGSDLYQRTFEISDLAKNTWHASLLGTTGIDIVDLQGFVEWYKTSDDTLSARQTLSYFDSTGERNEVFVDSTGADLSAYFAYSGSNQKSNCKAVITIKYTKPSVQANALNTNIQQTEEPTDEMR